MWVDTSPQQKQRVHTALKSTAPTLPHFSCQGTACGDTAIKRSTVSETERNNGAALLYLTCGRSASTHSSPRQMPAAPATAPRHGEMGQSACPMLPGKLPTGLCPSPGNTRYQPSTAASFCPSCCLFAQQSPKARPHTLLTLT